MNKYYLNYSFRTAFLIVVLLAVMLLTGCSRDIQTGVMPTLIGQTNNDRFEVKLVQVFRDDLAYGYLRGIYILKDKKSGKEYLGISGVGISEIGTHSDGDDTIKHEK